MRLWKILKPPWIVPAFRSMCRIDSWRASRRSSVTLLRASVPNEGDYPGQDTRSAHSLRTAGLRGAAAGLSALLLAATSADDHIVVQQHRAFSVSQISLPAGGTLRFSNEDDFTHEVYVETPEFTYESDEQEPGTVLAVVFPKSGHFAVRCHIHPKMHLDVDVQ
jgi:plastocyanin